MTEITALTLPQEDQFRRDVQAINRFQQIVHSTLVKDQDYGVIPGTTKPTLLKPGAEKIAKLLGLADSYELVDRQEDWSKGFFRYIVKCRLTSVAHNVVISEGMGECNSMESKYRWRWVGERDLPSSYDSSKLVSQQRKSRNGGHWTVYRIENDDIYSHVNTILKMAKKRALVDAALSAGRLSEVFTQDVEDLTPNVTISDPVIDVDTSTGEIKDHYCKTHNTKFYRNEKDGRVWYSHKIAGTSQWCNEQPETSNGTPAPDAPEIFDQEQVTALPTTRKGLFEWAKAHGRTYTPTWVVNQLGLSSYLELNDDPETIGQAHQTIKEIAGWDS